MSTERSMRAAKIVSPQTWSLEDVPVPEPGEGECRVVETVGGSADTLLGACDAVRPGGAVSVLGLFDRLPDLQPFPMLLKECTLAWSNCYCHPSKEKADFSVAAGLIDAERELLGRLATHRVPLDEVGRAFGLAADKSSGAVKVTVHPWA